MEELKKGGGVEKLAEKSSDADLGEPMTGDLKGTEPDEMEGQRQLLASSSGGSRDRALSAMFRTALEKQDQGELTDFSQEKKATGRSEVLGL